MKHYPETLPSPVQHRSNSRPGDRSLFSSIFRSFTPRHASSVVAAAVILTGAVNAQTALVSWDFAGLTGYGSSPLAPTAASPNLTVAGLTRGSGLATSGSAGANAWGGSEWNGTALLTTSAAAIADGAFVTFTLTPNTGYSVSLSGIPAYNVRRSNFGPTTGLWQYSLDGSTFTDIGLQITWGTNTGGTGNVKDAIDLSGLAPLQNIAAGTTVTFRVVNWGASGTGTWYFNSLATAGSDLVINGTVTSVGGDLPPTILPPLSPADGASGVSIAANLVASFSENVVPITESTGNVKLYKTTGPQLVESFPINSPQLTISANTLTINPTANLDYSTEYYVTIDTGMFEDATGNDFTGLNVATDWNFSTEAAPPPPSVVINKYLNGTPELIELLVVGTGVTGTTVDLRGMFIKDFSGSMEVDNGGKFAFTTDTLWSNVPVGTLIVLSKSAVSNDTTSGDFSLSIGLDDPLYFTSSGGTFDISTTDMVMIKSAAGGANGVTGGIHAFGGGLAGSLFNSFTGAKLLSSGTTGNGVAAIATNATSTIGDYSGIGATSSALAASAFGSPNNTENLVYINALRGIVPGDGSGVASLTNAAGAFAGKNIFDDAQTDNQSVKISVSAQVPSVTLKTVEITVPAGMGVASNATVTGAGTGTYSVSIASQVVTISGLAVTNTNLIEITLEGLDTPVTNSSGNGTQAFIIKSAIDSGTLTAIAAQPVANVIIPIEAIRDVNPTTGVALDLNSIVAVEGVCTESQVYTNNTLAYLQDGDFGVAIFNSNPIGNPFIVGRKFAVLGTVAQFSGVTQVAPSSFANVIDLGLATSPAPLVITIPNLLLNPEAYEGRLVTVENLSTATWTGPVSPAASVSVTLSDNALPTPNSLAILITSASGAQTGPGGVVNITGIFSQTDGSSPFTSGYQLLPREADDVDPVGSGFLAWIDAFYPGVNDPLIIGYTADPDGDGISNGVEALIGGNPSVAGVFGTTELVKEANTLSFVYPQDKNIPAGISAAYEWSTDMVTWNGSGATQGGVTVTLADSIWDDTAPEVTTYQVVATVTAGTPAKLFVRVLSVNE